MQLSWKHACRSSCSVPLVEFTGHIALHLLLKTTAGKSNSCWSWKRRHSLKSHQSILLWNLIKGWRTLRLLLEHINTRYERGRYYLRSQYGHFPSQGRQNTNTSASLAKRGGTGDQQVPFPSFTLSERSCF